MSAPQHIKEIASIGRLLQLWGEPALYDRVVGWWLSGISAHFEVGDGDGVYSITDIVQGHRADAHIRLLTPRFRGADSDPLHKATIEWAMETLGLKRLGAPTQATNKAAIAMAKRLGFKEEGILRSYGHDGKMPIDIWLGSIVK